MKNNHCLEHGFYKGGMCNACQKNILIKIRKEYEDKLSKEERIKIENNWKYGNI